MIIHVLFSQLIALVVMFLSRLGNRDTDGLPDPLNNKYIPFGDGSIDFIILGDLVAYGYVLILTCQLIGLLAGDKALVQVWWLVNFASRLLRDTPTYFLIPGDLAIHGRGPVLPGNRQ